MGFMGRKLFEAEPKNLGKHEFIDISFLAFTFMSCIFLFLHWV